MSQFAPKPNTDITPLDFVEGIFARHQGSGLVPRLGLAKPHPNETVKNRIGFDTLELKDIDQADHVSIALYKPDDDQAANSGNFQCMAVVVLDDVGEKVSRPNLQPSWRMQTSVKADGTVSEQWGYIIKDPIDVYTDASAFVKLLCEKGLTDKNATNAVRWVRLPWSEPVHKKGVDADNVARLVEWTPERMYTMDELRLGFGLRDPIETTSQPLSARAMPQRAVRSTSDRSSYTGWVHDLCDQKGDNAAKQCLRDALKYIRLGDDDRTKHRDIMMGLQSTGFDFAWEIADEWSQAAGGNYDYDENLDQWNSYKPHGGYTVGVVLSAACSAGWDEWKWRGLVEDQSEVGDEVIETSFGDVSVVHGERDIAEIILPRILGQMLYNATTKKWMFFDGVWVEEKRNRAFYQIDQEVARLRDNLPETGDRRLSKLRRDMSRGSFTNDVMRFLSSRPGVAVEAGDFDQDPHLVGCPSGYINLETGKLHQPDPSKMISKRTAVDPASTANCPKFKRMLEEAHRSQTPVIEFLQRYAGLSLSGIMREEKMLYFIGSGGNGKSVYVGALGHVMGDYHAVASEDAFTTDKSGKLGGSESIACLSGVRSILLSELNDGRQWSMVRVKQFTGNEDKIRARFLYQNSFEFRPVGKLTVVANEELTAARIDDAVRRRLLVVPWPNKPANVNVTLKEELAEEAPSILRWIIDGYQMYRKNGLRNVPAAIVKRSEEYMLNQDDNGRFVADCLRPAHEPSTHLVKKKIQMVWDQWAYENEIEKPTKRVGRVLTGADLTCTRSSAGDVLKNFELTPYGEQLLERRKDKMSKKE